MAKENIVARVEIDEGLSRKTGLDKMLESRSVKRAISWGAAAVTAMTIGLESRVMAEASPSDLQNETPITATSGVDLSQYKTLEAGYKGEEVVKLKQRMVDLGYFKNSSSVNDTFTSSTAEYVKKFETINGLPVDGVADPEMQALFFSGAARRSDGKLASPELKEAQAAVAQANREEEEEKREQERQLRIKEFLAGIDLSQYKILTTGYIGPEVMRIKERMYELGYITADMLNSFYLAKTNENVSEFEKINGLQVDGDADPEMQAILFSDLALRRDGSAIPVEVDVTPLTELTEEEKVNRRFSNFLNGAGEYSEEKIRKRLTGNLSERRGLGFFGVTGKDILVQAMLLHYEIVGSNHYLALGVKNRKNERDIFVVEWITGLSQKLESRAIRSFPSSYGTNETNIFFSTIEETKYLLEDRVGDCIIANFSFKKTYPPEGLSINYTYFSDYKNTRCSINLNFAAGLLKPERFIYDEKDFYKKIENVKSKIPGIDSLSEMKERISTVGDNMPAMWAYEYYINQQ